MQTLLSNSAHCLLLSYLNSVHICPLPIASGYSQQSSVVTLECAPPTLMANESEGEIWKVDITLMYAENLPFLPTSSEQQTQKVPEVVKKEKDDKSLGELLGEQDKSESRDLIVCHVTFRL